MFDLFSFANSFHLFENVYVGRDKNAESIVIAFLKYFNL